MERNAAASVPDENERCSKQQRLIDNFDVLRQHCLCSSKRWTILGMTNYRIDRIGTHRHASALNLTTSTWQWQNRGRGMKVRTTIRPSARYT